MKKNNTLIRVDPEMKKLLTKVKLERLKAGKGRKLLSDRRLSKAITRIPNIENMLVKWEINDDD